MRHILECRTCDLCEKEIYTSPITAQSNDFIGTYMNFDCDTFQSWPVDGTLLDICANCCRLLIIAENKGMVGIINKESLLDRGIFK